MIYLIQSINRWNVRNSDLTHDRVTIKIFDVIHRSICPLQQMKEKVLDISREGLVNIRRRLLYPAIERCTSGGSLRVRSPLKKQTVNLVQVRCQVRERPPWSWRGQRGVTAAPWLGLLRVFKCVDDPGSLPIVGEDRRVLDTQVLLDVVALWMEHDRY